MNVWPRGKAENKEQHGLERLEGNSKESEGPSQSCRPGQVEIAPPAPQPAGKVSCRSVHCILCEQPQTLGVLSYFI